MRTNVTRQFRSRNETSTLSFPVTNVHCVGTFVPGNESARERNVPVRTTLTIVRALPSFKHFYLERPIAFVCRSGAVLQNKITLKSLFEVAVFVASVL